MQVLFRSKTMPRTISILLRTLPSRNWCSPAEFRKGVDHRKLKMMLLMMRMMAPPIREEIWA